MNTINASLRQPLLDPEWNVAIAEELERNPAGVPFAVEPFAMGQYDAEHGFPCDPTGRGYRKLGDVEMYIIAYKDAAEAWAAAVQEVNDALHAPVDYQAELLALLDGIDDENFWRTGC